MVATAQLGETEAIAALTEARERTLSLVAAIGDDDLERVHSTLMSPLVWDLGHIAAFEDLWLAHRHGERPLLREGLAEIYDAFETPRAQRGDLDFLGPVQAREYLAEVRARVDEVLRDRGPGDGTTLELVVRHEHQHTETMLQTMQLAGLTPFAPAPPTPAAGPAPSGLDMLEIEAGPCEIGAPSTGFAYDNERPRHRVTLPAFRIGRTAVTNGDFREWIEAGGYRRAEWWSPEGWRWRTEQSAQRPAGWSEDLEVEWRLGTPQPLDPARTVVHVCHHEADAFARAHGARLPTEQEWEKAATWDPATQRSLPAPWGEGPARPGVHANVDQLHGGTVGADALPAATSPSGCTQMIGDAWEWTSTVFTGYPGFRAFPYREYSEVFFDAGYRVLRGGSWASRPRVATASFRNWDFPERRQIFAGLRLARDL